MRLFLARALRARCLMCGRGKPFRGPLRMRESCEVCGYTFARESGYFIGSAYMSFIFAILAQAATFGLLSLLFDWSFERKLPVMFAVGVLFPLWFFRYARGLWMAIDFMMGRPEGDIGSSSDARVLYDDSEEPKT